jgi:hypothetical protein
VWLVFLGCITVRGELRIPLGRRLRIGMDIFALYVRLFCESTLLLADVKGDAHHMLT